MSNFIGNFLNYIAPHQCLLCAGPSAAALCEACKQTVQYWEASNSCPRCGQVNTKGYLCGGCQKAPPAFDRSYAAFLYTEPLSALIQAAKFANRWSLLPPLGEYFAQLITAEHRPNRLIALPLHPARLRERGFNQAVEIARPIAKRFQLPLEIDTLQRIKNTEHQARLNANARWQNMRGAFVYAGDLSGQSVAIVDDVMTSGASLNAAAKALKLAGAIEVQAWVIARTP